MKEYIITFKSIHNGIVNNTAYRIDYKKYEMIKKFTKNCLKGKSKHHKEGTRNLR